MTSFILSYLAGALTILAPCILPVIPFVFARVDQPFVRNGLPLLAGMALSFAAVATLATLGGSWATEVNDAGRNIALCVLAAMGLALLVPRLSDRLTRPLVAFGNSLSEVAQRDSHSAGPSVISSLTLGVATGFLWAPCAGPVLGLVLTTAALQGASAHTSLLLLSYAAGASTSLALALWMGGRVFESMKRLIGFGEWIRRGLGVAVLAGVSTVALGWDTGLLAKLPPLVGDSIEQRLMEHLGPTPSAAVKPSNNVQLVSVEPVAHVIKTVAPQASQISLPVEGVAAEFSGATGWLNSSPLTLQSLRGKVVLVDFWTFACINCQRALPHVRAWAEKYKDEGLVVVGVHAPEFAFERNAGNVKRAVGELGLNFPIVIDNDFAIWRAYSNQYWPANYFIDAQGRIRFHHFGEGEYERSEQVIQQLLQEARGTAGVAPSAPGRGKV